jgi:hypothetical protein
MRPRDLPIRPPRAWITPSWGGPGLYRGRDEWGRRTLAVQIGPSRALVIPYRWDLEDERCPATGLLHFSWRLGEVQCSACRPVKPHQCWYCAAELHPLAVPRWVLLDGTPRPVHFRDCRPSRDEVRTYLWVRRNADKPHRCPGCHVVAPWRMGMTPRLSLGIYRPLRMWCKDCGYRWWSGRLGDHLGYDTLEE